MVNDGFLYTKEQSNLKSNFIKEGWVTCYRADYDNKVEDILIYSYIVNSNKVKTCLENPNWEIAPSREGKPSIFGNNKYLSNSEKGFEPLLFVKHFKCATESISYIDVSEEFVLYFRLLEKGGNKQSRIFYFLDDNDGELEEVIRIEPKLVKIKYKYLLEYISIRKVNLVIAFNFIRFSDLKLSEMELQPAVKIYSDSNYKYSHELRDSIVSSTDGIKSDSYINGKYLIEYDKKKPAECWYSAWEKEKHEKFITGIDDEGNNILEGFENTNEKAFKLTYFKKDVLSKYYNEPDKYEVTDFSLESKFYSLKMDNNHDDYVAVFLTDLRSLTIKEQKYWALNNIPPKEGMWMSQTYYNVMIKGSWEECPETADYYFKYKYELFNEAWYKKYGWHFYKKLSKQDEYRFTALHIPINNNIKEFCEQMLSLVVITIDSLNEKEFEKIVGKNDGDKGIDKFERFLKMKHRHSKQMIAFLRNLQSLRSSFAAHRFSDKNAKKPMDFFKLKDNNYVEVAREIFVGSVFTMNTLEKAFLNIQNEGRNNGKII